MSTIYSFNTEELATNYVGIIAEYIDFDLMVMGITKEMIDWAETDLRGLVAHFCEQVSGGKTYSTLLFSDAEDAVAFKLRFV